MPCGHDMFQCRFSRECLPMAKYCDMSKDCKDGTDEEQCGLYIC